LIFVPYFGVCPVIKKKIIKRITAKALVMRAESPVIMKGWLHPQIKPQNH